MDTEQSLENIRDFEQRINEIGDPLNERFIRLRLATIVRECPVSVLASIATSVLQIRKSELRQAGETN